MGRPSQPIITKAGAAQAALEIIDDQGLDKLSLQVLAKHLGVKAPSLYYHFKNKAELLASIAKMILNGPATLKTNPDEDWKQAMIDVSLTARRSLMKHPNAAPLLLEFFPRHIMLPAYDHWTSHYPVKPELKLIILDGLEKLTFGSALLGSMSRAKGLAPIPEFEPEDFPSMAQTVRANNMNEEELFVEVIRRFLTSFD